MRKMQSVADLLDLQALDLAIDGLLERRSNLPELAAYKAAHDDLVDVTTRLSEASRDLTGVHHALTQLEDEIEAARTRREDAQVKMYTAGIPARDAENLALEVEQLGRQIDSKETEQLGLLEQADELGPRVDELTERRDRLTATKAELEATIKTEWASIDAELARKEARKETEVAAIDPDLLAVYERIRAAKGGVAVGELTDNICGACHVGLSSAEVYAMRDEELPRCVHCARLLVL